MSYAKDTTVSPEKSRAEIESLLRRYGADQIMAGWEETRALVAFRAAGRMVRFELAFPPPDDKRFLRDGRGARRSPERRRKAYDQEVRRRWRALALVIKAKLEAASSGIETFEEAFLAHIVLPDNTRMADWAVPQIAEAYESGQMPPLLPAAGGTQ